MTGGAAIVTGASGGIGEAICRRLAAEGWHVVVGDLDGSAARDVAAAIRSESYSAVGSAVDVRDFDSLEALTQLCLSEFGTVDLLVANAGVVEEGSFSTGDPTRYRDVVETNLIGSILAVRSVLPVMVSRRSGHVVLMASVSGRETYVGQPVYISSKWGLVGFGRSLRKELVPTGVNVTLLEPGLVDTSMARSSPLGREFLEEIEALTPNDIADAVLYAVSRENRVAINELVIQPRQQGI